MTGMAAFVVALLCCKCAPSYAKKLNKCRRTRRDTRARSPVRVNAGGEGRPQSGESPQLGFAAGWPSVHIGDGSLRGSDSLRHLMSVTPLRLADIRADRAADETLEIHEICLSSERTIFQKVREEAGAMLITVGAPACDEARARATGASAARSGDGGTDVHHPAPLPILPAAAADPSLLLKIGEIIAQWSGRSAGADSTPGAPSASSSRAVASTEAVPLPGATAGVAVIPSERGADGVSGGAGRADLVADPQLTA